MRETKIPHGLSRKGFVLKFQRHFFSAQESSFSNWMVYLYFKNKYLNHIVKSEKTSSIRPFYQLRYKPNDIYQIIDSSQWTKSANDRWYNTFATCMFTLKHKPHRDRNNIRVRARARVCVCAHLLDSKKNSSEYFLLDMNGHVCNPDSVTFF